MQLERTNSMDMLADSRPDASKVIVDRQSETVFSLNETVGAASDACSRPNTLAKVPGETRRSLDLGVTDDLALEAILQLRERNLVTPSESSTLATRHGILTTLGGIALPIVACLTMTEQRAHAKNALSAPPCKIVRTSIRSLLALAGLLFAFLLMSQPALAIKSMNCPKEPATDTRIASGDVYAGSNCELYTPGDTDSFVFSAKNGDTWRIIVGYQGGGFNTCMALYDPNNNKIFPKTCTNGGSSEVFDSQTLTVTGQYTIDITMGGGQCCDADYALSLERINPVPPDAQSIALAQAVDGTLSPPTAQQAYTFFGVTTGTYEVSVSYNSGTANTCILLYYPGAATPQPGPDQGCTNGGTSRVQFSFVPPQNGTYMALIYGDRAATGSYGIEVSCLSGTCSPPPPACVLEDAPSYNATTGTLTMNFTLATPVTATWNGWLTSGNTIEQLWSTSEPIEPVINVTQTASVPANGKVGVLSTLTTVKTGITCSSWKVINTRP